MLFFFYENSSIWSFLSTLNEMKTGKNVDIFYYAIIKYFYSENIHWLICYNIMFL